MNIGHSIKLIREGKGYNQKTFAEMCGITSSYLSQIENNQKTPHSNALKTIADRLDVPLPIIYFLSIDETDIKPEKREIFNLMVPTVKAMLSTFFTNVSN